MFEESLVFKEARLIEPKIWKIIKASNDLNLDLN